MNAVRRSLPLLLVTGAMAALGACAPVADAPSLARRPAESIDPRLPVVDRSASLPADPALAAAWRSIAAPAFAQAPAVEAAIDRASALAAGAGPRGSESWIAAQQALSAAIGEGEAVTRATGAFDAAVADRIVSGQRLVPQDLAAARRISEELTALDRKLRQGVDAVQQRLAR